MTSRDMPLKYRLQAAGRRGHARAIPLPVLELVEDLGLGFRPMGWIEELRRLVMDDVWEVWRGEGT